MTKDFVRSKPRIVRYISGVHMGLAHLGLKKIAGELIDGLDSGEFVIFMNSKQNAFKLLAPNNILVYYRHPKNHRIDPRVISLIPLVFDGKEIKMDLALKKVLEKDFKKIGS